MDIEDALILVVDDNEMNRDMLSRRLERQGHRSLAAEDGLRAMELLRVHSVDLILLDIMMPRLNGYEVLEQVKADETLRHIPVIMISAVDDLDSVVRCVELGAEDYLFKPFNPILLKARINASLEKKRLLDRERQYQIGMNSTLPAAVAERVQRGDRVADFFPEEVTVLVAHFRVTDSRLSPVEIAEAFRQLLADFDRLTAQRGLYGFKTIGPAYGVMSGAPVPQADHTQAVAALALEMQALVNPQAVELQMGIHTGVTYGGVIQPPFYDLWGGDVAETAYRLCLASRESKIRVSPAAAERLQSWYTLEPSGTLDNLPVYRLLSS